MAETVMFIGISLLPGILFSTTLGLFINHLKVYLKPEMFRIDSFILRSVRI